MKSLVLYYKPSCPYCQRVLNFMKDEGIELEKHDILTDHEALETLIRVGGRQQVPCLFIDGKPLYESSDIITFLANEV